MADISVAMDQNSFQPLDQPTPQTSAASGAPHVQMDHSTFEPLTQSQSVQGAPPQAPNVDMQEVPVMGTGSDFAQGISTHAAQSLAAAGHAGSHIPGVEYVSEKVGDILGLPKLPKTTNPYTTVQHSTAANADAAENTVAGSGGSLLEGLGEWVTGEEALKGLSLGEKMLAAAKATKILETYPKLAKLAQLGKQVEALHVAGKIARTAASGATVGAVQGSLHTEPGQEAEGAEAGALGGGLGAGAGEALGEGIGAVSKYIKRPLTEAEEAAAKAPGALRPGVETVSAGDAIQDVPVRATGKTAHAAESLMSNEQKGTLQEFEVGKTQPAIREGVSKVTADAAGIENAANSATKEDPFGFGGHSEVIQGRAQAAFKTIDEASGGAFSKAQRAAKTALRQGDYEAYEKALDSQDAIVEANKGTLDPDVLSQAKADWKQGAGLDELQQRFAKTVDASPKQLVKDGVDDPGYIKAKQFRSAITDARQAGEFEKAGFEPEHIQAIEKLGVIADDQQVKFNETVSRLGDKLGGKLTRAVMAGSAAGFGGNLEHAAYGAAAELGAEAGVGAAKWTAGQVLSWVMTRQPAVEALTAGLKSGASADGIAASLMSLWKNESGR